ncbi:TPA: hypothetical protein KLD42_001673 [Legionella pneumophila]|nr:hypothetical protein [Legionella pneumophila]
MLKDWQVKFPKSFEQFPNLFTELDFEEQEYLSQLLHLINNAGTGLLDEETVSRIFDNSSHISELTALISLISNLKCLNKSMLNYLFTNHYLPDLQESIDTLSSQTSLSTDVVTFLFSTKNPQDCVEFMMRALKNGVDLTNIVNYLSQHVDLAGLNRAITLFDLSSFNYKQEHFPKFSILSSVLANPLCQTIFDARLRGFSDYSELSEPLPSIDANEIINQLVDLVDEETKAQIFFDFFVPFRPFPPSQKYIVDVDVADKVARVLQAPEMKSTLRMKNGVRVVFDKIKYEIASHIESEDLCSTRNYKDLMNEIWSILNQLHKGHGYQGFFAEELRQHSFLTDTGPKDMMDVETQSPSISM